MAKQLTYIQIIKSMIGREINDYVWKRSEHIADVEEITLEKFDEYAISWTAIVKVDYLKYEIHGIMYEFGDVYISSITYERTRSDAEEWWKPENQYKVHEFLYGDQLETFAFDK